MGKEIDLNDHFIVINMKTKKRKSGLILEKKVYYVFLFLKVSQCKLKQTETHLKLGNTLKSKSKFTKSKIGLDASISASYQGFILNPLGAF
jgi:hypothetical protein